MNPNNPEYRVQDMAIDLQSGLVGNFAIPRLPLGVKYTVETNAGEIECAYCSTHHNKDNCPGCGAGRQPRKRARAIIYPYTVRR